MWKRECERGKEVGALLWLKLGDNGVDPCRSRKRFKAGDYVKHSHIPLSEDLEVEGLCILRQEAAVDSGTNIINNKLHDLVQLKDSNHTIAVCFNQVESHGGSVVGPTEMSCPETNLRHVCMEASLAPVPAGPPPNPFTSSLMSRTTYSLSVIQLLV
ncbi:hypothetical protein BS17DRAFT_767398 [Gyrodon lividus]|nr:hypothetical protein BS17DRAFT_767398 [Gyrodon lividus]